MSPTPKTILFDFDGTLADTLDLALSFGNQNQHRFSKVSISREDFRERSMREVLNFLELPWYKLPQFVLELKAHMRENLHQVSLFPGIADLMKELHGRGFALYVLSSNSHENIDRLLTQHEIRDCFRGIVSDSSIFGKHVVLDRFFQTQMIKKEQALYIGDEVRDAEACRKCGVDMVAVAWGWDSAKRLRQVENLRIVEGLPDLRWLLLGGAASS